MRQYIPENWPYDRAVDVNEQVIKSTFDFIAMRNTDFYVRYQGCFKVRMLNPWRSNPGKWV